MLNGCTFSVAHAEYVADFFPRFLCHSKGEFAGQPFELLDYQRDDIIFPLFGWLNEDRRRRFRTAYIELPKKNGKSTLAAGVGCYMLVGDGEQGAEVYSAATDRDQASIVHREAINMVEASPELSAILRINKTTRNIAFEETLSYYRALSSAPAGKEGLNGHCCICDELHVWKGRILWDALRYMGAARRQPLIFVITTAGSDLQSVCYEQRLYAQQVLAGTFQDDRFFAYIRAVEAADVDLKNSDREKQTGLFDPRLWRQANPSLGVTITEKDFAADIDTAVQNPTSLASFLRYRFNVWATSESPWLDQGCWIACRVEFEPEELLGQRCGAGLDLAKILDLTSLALVFPDPDEADPLYRLLTWFWLPAETADARRDLVPLRLWGDQGLIKLTPGNVCDYETVEQDVVGLSKQFKIWQLNFDPWNAEASTQRLEKAGIKRCEFRQTMANFADATKEFERLVRRGRILTSHKQKVLDWQAGHVQVHTDASGNIRPVKPKHGDYRTIDGIVAAIMGLERAQAMPKPPKGKLFLTA